MFFGALEFIKRVKTQNGSKIVKKKHIEILIFLGKNTKLGGGWGGIRLGLLKDQIVSHFLILPQSN